MDFVRLGAPYSSAYIPDHLIEGYNSLVWTERYQEFGEFELKSFDVGRLMSLLPEDTLVSHLETKEVMVVETVEIAMAGEGLDAKPEITIRGRSATAVLEDRVIKSTYQKKRKMRRKYTATGAAAVLLVQAVDNASGADLTRGDTDPDTPTERNNYSWNTTDVIPNVAVTEGVGSEGTTRHWWLEGGILYPQLQKILIDADLGIRTIRPVSPNPGTVVTVNAALATRGTVVRTSSTDIAQLRFDIYKGVDRSSTVQFSLLQGHLEKPQYLNSDKDYKNVVSIKSGETEMSDIVQAGEPNITGWRRRVMEYDAGTPEIPPEPQKPAELKKNATKAQKQARAEAMDKWIDDHAKWRDKRLRIIGEFENDTFDDVVRELKRQRKVNMFTGDVSLIAPYQYGTHYRLGDTVMLFGDYGRSAKMVVSEYVRTEDANGERGFPGLVEP